MVRDILRLFSGETGSTRQFEYDHYTDATDDIKKLKRKGKHQGVENLCLWCIEQAEREAQEEGWNEVPPAYYRHLAIVYRKDDQHTDEVNILERYIEAGGRKQSMRDRLDRAQELAMQADAEERKTGRGRVSKNGAMNRENSTTDSTLPTAERMENGVTGRNRALIDVLRTMDDYDFEHFVAELWERRGWETTVSEQSGDRGIDVVATKSVPYEQKILIQAKRYGENTTVGSPDIQQYASLKNQQPGVDQVLVVTTNRFTNQATEIAQQLNVKCIDGNDLVRLVEEESSKDLVEKYASEEVIGHGSGHRDTWESGSVVGKETERKGKSDTNSKGWSTTEPSIIGRFLPEGRWEYVLAAFLMYLLSATGSTPGGDEILVVAAWIGMALAIYTDGIRWEINHRRYTAIALIPGIGILLGPWYLFKRWRAIGLERELEFDL